MKPSTVIVAGGAGASPTRPIQVSGKSKKEDSLSDEKDTSASAHINPSTGHETFELVPLEDERVGPNDSDGTAQSLTSKDEQDGVSPGENENVNSMDNMTDALMHDASDTMSAAEKTKHDIIWLIVCFFGIMFSLILYGLLLEYTTSGGRKLHELSFLFITSLLYTITAAAGRHVRGEKPTSIPPARFAVLGITSMGSTFCSVRSLRYEYNEYD